MPVVRELLVKLGVELDESSIDRADSSIDKLKTAANTLVAAFAAGAVAAGYKKIIGAASAAAERVNKFEAVFTDASDGVQLQLDGISRRTGIASGQLQEYAANIGAIVKPSLGSSEAAGKMGASIAELALDIASFNDVEPSDALVSLRSGLIGSAEPLQRFGVDTRVAALQAEALRQGVTRSVESMSEGERIQLRYAAIMRQLGAQGALGDAAKTADGLANATRGLNSQYKALTETIGSFFLEDATRTVIMLRGLVAATMGWLKANDGIIRQRINLVLQVINNTIEGIVIGVKYLIRGFSYLSDIIGPLASNILLAVGAIALLVAILGLPIVLVLALGAAIGLVIDDLVVWSKGGVSLFGILIEGIKEFLAEFGLTGPALDLFFSGALDKIKEFTDVGVKKAKEMFDVIAAFIGSALKDIFGGTIGRVIIDLLGAKAGAVVGEFIGRLIGTLAGKIAGKGIVGKAISSKIGASLFGLAGKGAGALAGGLAADQLALGLQGLINAPSGPLMSGVGGGTSINAPVTATANISVTQQPGESGTDLAGRVKDEFDAFFRQEISSAAAATTPAVGGG